MEFKEMTKRDAVSRLMQELIKLRKTSDLPVDKNEMIDKEFDGFRGLFDKYLQADVAAPIDWEKIEKLPQGSILPYGQLSEAKDKTEIKAMLDKLVVVKPMVVLELQWVVKVQNL